MSNLRQDSIKNIAFAALICLAIGAVSAASAMIPLRFVLALCGGILLIAGSLFFRDKKLFFFTLLIFFLPININKAVFRIDNAMPYLSDTLPFYAVDAFLIILYVIWAYRTFHGGNGRKVIWMTPIMFFLLLMIFADILSLINAVNFGRSFIEIAAMVKVVLAYFYILNNIVSMKEIKIIITAMAIGLLLQTAIVLMQVYSGGTLGFMFLGEPSSGYLSYEGGHQIFRPAGLFPHPNGFANYLEFLIPLMFAMAFIPRDKWLRRLATAGLFAGGVALIYSLSRGGWAGVTFAVILVFFYLTARNMREKRFFFKSIFVILIAVFVATAYSSKIIKRITLRDAGAAKTRLLQYEVAKKIIIAHPLAGVGINNYNTVMESYDDTPSRISRVFKLPIHTVYLEYFAETGILGFFALISLVTVILVTGLRNIGRARGILYNLNLGLVFGFAAYFIHAISDMNYLSRIPVFAYFAGLFSVVNYAINNRIVLDD